MDENTQYVHLLAAHSKFVQLESIRGVYAVAEERRKGILGNKWLLVEERGFVDGERIVNVLVCDCPAGYEAKVRLEATNPLISEDLDKFRVREENNYCKHCSAVRCLRSPVAFQQNSSIAEVISNSPFVAVANGGSAGYGLIQAGHKQFKCLTCKQPNCSHLDAFKQWNENQGTEQDDDYSALQKAFSEIKLTRQVRSKDFSCVSTAAIPWPVNQQYRKTKTKIDTHGFPLELRPKKLSNKCKHGLRYKLVVLNMQAIIHRESTYKYVKLFQYNTEGCDCEINYDGQDSLLLNLNNRDLFDLDWLFSILDRTNHSICPLKTVYTTSELAKKRCDVQSKVPVLTYHRLRDAYHCFLR